MSKRNMTGNTRRPRSVDETIPPITTVAITDSEVAPLAQISKHVILVPTQSPSFFHAMSPACAVAEILAAIVAGHGGDSTLAALRRTDEHHAALNVHLKPHLARR